MLPDPLHPAIVHLPIALAVLLPLAALASALAVARGWLPGRAWVLVVALHALLVASAFLAVETGEHEEERVERAVSERFIEAHEERAESFLWIAAAALAVTGAGMLSGALGSAARAGSVIAALGVLVAGAAVGHSGGELVYRHGAASAYVQKSGVGGTGELAAADERPTGTDAPAAAASQREHDRDDDD